MRLVRPSGWWARVARSLQITVYQPFGATRVGGSANANSYEFTILIDGRFPLGTTEDCSTGSSALPIVATRRGRRHALHLARHRLDQSSKTIIGCGVSSSRRMRVATKNFQRAPKSLEFDNHRRIVAGMLKLKRSIVSRLAHPFRNRAVVELENLALRHQLHVLRRKRPGRLRLFTFDRMLWVLLYSIVAALFEDDGVGQAGNCDPMAPSGIQPVLAMAFEMRAAVSGTRDSRSDSANEQRQPALG
jgi:hypothetical protein